MYVKVLPSIKTLNRTDQCEETSKDHLVQLPDHLRANQKSEHVIEGVSLLNTDGHGASARKPVPVPDHSQDFFFFLTSSLNLPWCSSVPASVLPILREL